MSAWGLRAQPSTATLCPRCRHVIECASTHISSLSRPPLFTLLTRISSAQKAAHRPFHASSTRIKDEPKVLPNSLEKTLQVHRSCNRASLLRKVTYNQCSPDFLRPVLSSGNHSDYKEQRGLEQRPQELTNARCPSSGRQGASRKPVKRKQRTRFVAPRLSPPSTGVDDLQDPGWLRSTTYAHPPKLGSELRWDVNEKKHRLAQFPWLAYVDKTADCSNGISRLDAEIRALERYLTPTCEEQATVDQIVEKVSALLEAALRHRPQVIGSRRTGMALGHSDLDFVILVGDPDRPADATRKPRAMRPEEIERHVDVLEAVASVLQESPMFGGQVLTIDGRTPVLTATHTATSLRLQFYSGEGPPSSVEYVKDFQAEYPALRPLYMVTRMILEVHALFGAEKASLTPYDLLLLIVASLKMNHGRFQRSDSLGEHLLHILHTYGKVINFRTTGVAIDPPGFFNWATVWRHSKAYEPDQESPYLRGQRALIKSKRTAAAKGNRPVAERVCIQDPANYMNDVGITCVRSRRLQEIFTATYDRLSAAVSMWDEAGTNCHGGMLTHVLKANFDDFEQLKSCIAYPKLTTKGRL